ncbi:protein-glutamate methylesterase/protein-glutamine glutaminase [Nocardioides campestrisoli]|uniref:protein-glutamate methylesterase/protein-glutamine glutaminase n=1 Tax=Nocardioides campestrisoli TaxID=2736757 RepID=UPI002810A0F4|nr:chemotaxis response regulator protein-glutamate methylesterase [Nocardioides campestrisoli]
MISVLVVDDSATVRRIVTTALETDPGVAVVGQAVDGEHALDLAQELAPDAVVLDIEMPVLDGLAALRRLRAANPRLPVIMFSTLTERGAMKTLEALSLGASDYVTKPTGTDSLSASVREIADQLVPKIRALVGTARSLDSGGQPVPPPPLARPSPAVAPQVLMVGCSTGGPDALASLVSELPFNLRVPVVVVQHMPPVFTAMFASRLDRVSALSVSEAVDGEPLRAGHVYVAPGDRHLSLHRVEDRVLARIDAGPPENFCRPSVDVLFRSGAHVYGPAALGVVLTGMGHDGTAGARAVQTTGGTVLAQDQASSVVWGMPGAVVAAGLAHEVLALDKIAARLVELVRG